MTAVKLAISLERELAEQIKRSAAGEPFSGWIAEAARARLRREGWMQLISEYEAVHGEITQAEMDEVRREHLELRKSAAKKRSRAPAKKRTK